jgi:hypothetical protein
MTSVTVSKKVRQFQNSLTVGSKSFKKVWSENKELFIGTENTLWNSSYEIMNVNIIMIKNILITNCTVE